MVNAPIEDDYDYEYCDNLFRAAKELDKLVRKCKIRDGQAVFVHDTNAVTEGPALIIVYLALFLAHKDWEDIYALEKFVKMYDKRAMPNMRIVKMTIEKYKKFQEEMRDRLRREEEERRRAELEAQRLAELRAAQQEAERIRKLRLAEEEEERLRRERLVY